MSLLPGWNNGQSVFPDRTLLRCKYDDYECTLDPNDGIFLAKIAAAIQSLGAQGRVYLFGQSNGASISHRLAISADPAHLPIAGIAVQSTQLNSQPSRSGAGPFNYNQPQPDHPPIAQLSIHGTFDTSAPYGGGPMFKSPIFSLASEPTSNSLWAAHNGCTGPRKATDVSYDFSTRFPIPCKREKNCVRSPSFRFKSILQGAKDLSHMTRRDLPILENKSYASGMATRWTYTGCPDVAPVEWYRVPFAGHLETDALNGSSVYAVVMDFFERVERAHRPVPQAPNRSIG